MVRPVSFPRVRTLVAVVVGALALSACRVDADVAVTVDRDGHGTVAVTVTADAEVLREQPGLVEGVATDDLTAAGWTTEGPTATADGGASVVLTHPFTSIDEANAVLAQLSGTSGPFTALQLAQDRTTTRISTSISGAVLVDGTGAFTDPALVEALGGAPYTASLTDRGLTLDQALGLRLSLTVPGSVIETSGTADPADTENGTTTVRWVGALAGDAAAAPGQPITMSAMLDDDGARTAQRLRDFAFWMIPAWLVFFALVIVPVVYLRRRRLRG